MFKKRKISNTDTDEIKKLAKTGMVTNNTIYADESIISFEPRNYAEVQYVADNLKVSKAAIVKLGRLSKDDSRRVTDFLSGVIYSIDGSVKKLEENMYLFQPQKSSSKK